MNGLSGGRTYDNTHCVSQSALICPTSTSWVDHPASGMQALHPDPDQRFRCARDLVAALEALSPAGARA